jgi:hypothetical protein
MYNQAIAQNDTMRAGFIANMVGNSNAAANVFVNMSAQVAGGIDGLKANMPEKVREMFDAVAAALAGKKPDAGAAGKLADNSIKMSGGQTFNIKQEFRDSDPDRIAMVFKRDLVRAIESRRSAGVVSPFGAR